MEKCCEVDVDQPRTTCKCTQPECCGGPEHTQRRKKKPWMLEHTILSEPNPYQTTGVLNYSEVGSLVKWDASLLRDAPPLAKLILEVRHGVCFDEEKHNQ